MRAGNMRILLLCVALLLASLYHQVACRSGGAPSAACSTLSPDPTAHGADPQTSTVPYSIDLDQFCTNGTYSYTPGENYTLSLHGENDMPQLRGVLIQARLVSDDTTRVGTFAVNADSSTTTRLSFCTPPEDAITHSNGADKSSVYFDWTAPASGTGPIRFRFAAMQVQNTYWANQRTAMIAEAGSGGVGDACTTDDGGSGASQITGVGFSTLLMIALVVAIKVAL